MRRAAIVSPVRTPVGKFLGTLKDIPAGELAAVVIKALMARTGIDPQCIDDVVFAQGYGNGEAPCIARWAALAAGLPLGVPGYQLDRRCGSRKSEPQQRLVNLFFCFTVDLGHCPCYLLGRWLLDLRHCTLRL